MTALLPQPFGSLAQHLRGADPVGNVMGSIDYVTGGGDVSARAEMREAFRDSEQVTNAKLTAGMRVDFTRSAGPISDRFLTSSDPVAVIMGPRGSAKTTALFKKVPFEGQGIRPGPDGVRRYVVSVWREKYVNIWDATIGSWWKLFPAKLPGSDWNGSKPHPATHVLRFDDEFGRIECTVRFRAFGDSADSDDTLGNESTDVYLNQIDTLPEQLFTWLGAVIGRDPPRGLLYPDMPDDFVYGRIIGDMNAPTPLSWQYRDFIESPKPSYALYRQPGGLEPNAENLHVVGRGYYLNLIRINAHRKWWVKINVHNKPGFRRDTDTPFADWDDDVMVAPATLAPDPNLPVLVGEDGGLTPAAVYMQEMPSGQLRILAEVALERGGMKDLAARMLVVEAARFVDCEFHDRCDPSMKAGEDTSNGSDRNRLSDALSRKVELARTNNLDMRHDAFRDKLVIKGGEPMMLLDPSVKVLRRGMNGAYQFARIQGTTDRGNIKRDFTTHVMDAGMAGALECGSSVARRRTTDRRREREARRDQARTAGRYNPLQRGRSA